MPDTLNKGRSDSWRQTYPWRFFPFGGGEGKTGFTPTVSYAEVSHTISLYHTQRSTQPPSLRPLFGILWVLRDDL
jgi:hypothetical protein